MMQSTSQAINQASIERKLTKENNLSWPNGSYGPPAARYCGDAASVASTELTAALSVEFTKCDISKYDEKLRQRFTQKNKPAASPSSPSEEPIAPANSIHTGKFETPYGTPSKSRTQGPEPEVRVPDGVLRSATHQVDDRRPKRGLPLGGIPKSFTEPMYE